MDQLLRLLHHCGLPMTDVDMLHGSGLVMNQVTRVSLTRTALTPIAWGNSLLTIHHLRDCNGLRSSVPALWAGTSPYLRLGQRMGDLGGDAKCVTFVLILPSPMGIAH